MILLRPYTTEDSMELSRTIDQVCTDTPWMATRSFIPTASWVHVMENDNCNHHRLLVAEANGEIVGWCRSFPEDCEVPSSHAELGIGLLSQYRNQGIGTRLVRKSLGWAKYKNMKRVSLTVSPDNNIAVHVFKKCGFEPIKLVENKIIMVANVQRKSNLTSSVLISSEQLFKGSSFENPEYAHI